MPSSCANASCGVVIMHIIFAVLYTCIYHQIAVNEHGNRIYSICYSITPVVDLVECSLVVKSQITSYYLG